MKFTIKEFHERYPDDNACLDDLFERRYGHLTACPQCHRKTNFYRVSKRRSYSCQWCGHQIYPCAGTIFEKSDTPLKSWFFAIFLFSKSKNGVAAKELERQLGVTYKTAWRMAHQVRLLMGGDKKAMKGEVEADETDLGQIGVESFSIKEKQPGMGDIDKTPVIGFSSQLKNSIRGTYVWVSKKHLQKYVNEFAFRYNERDSLNPMFETLLAKV